MNLLTAFRLQHTTSRSLNSKIAIVGAGGKTTLLFQLAHEFQNAIVTTTTHLTRQQVVQGEVQFLVEKPNDIETLDGVLRAASHPMGIVTVTGKESGEGRIAGLDPTSLTRLAFLADTYHLPLLIEADGAKMKPVKAPADHEPAIPSFVDTVVVAAGLSALGKPLTSEWVHRPERFAALSGLDMGAAITSEALKRVLAHPNGGLKNIPAGARRIALLNQADTPELQGVGQGLASELLAVFQSVSVASLAPAIANKVATAIAGDKLPAVYAVHEPVAGIILAAGESRRLGRPKQLLDWHGEPFVRSAAKAALTAGLRPVVVVTGAHATEVTTALNGLSVCIANNEDWMEGQSSSIRAGLAEVWIKPDRLPQELERLWQPVFYGTQAGSGCEKKLSGFYGPGAAIFLLADQPQVQPMLIHALLEVHARTLAPIVAPLIDGRRGNPVLFDRGTFHDLQALSGETGGRALFAQYPVEWVPWHDAAMLLDVDTEDDYQRLLGNTQL